MKTLLCILTVSLFSCRSFEGLDGKYIKRGKDYKYSLTINKDSTFTLVTQSIHARSSCEGKWELAADTLLLKCSDEPFPAQIARGYMTDREKTVIVLSEKKLKLGQVVMKRIKD